MIYIEKYQEISKKDYELIKDVLVFDIDYINERLIKNQWDLVRLKGKDLDLLVALTFENEWLVMLAGIGKGAEKADVYFEKMAKNNGLRGIEVLTDKESIVKYYGRYGYTKTYVLRKIL